jgi:excinuclease ABC subunit C
MRSRDPLRPKPGEIPTDPGVYRFYDARGQVIYVGKARSLRPRLSSYFQDPAGLHPRTQSMVHTAAKVDWVVVRNEVEALSLEYAWIKEFDPRFNVKYRDDKSYPYLAVTLSDEFPRVLVVREAKRKGTRYFGPFAHAWAIRDTLDELLKVFPVRSCRDGVFTRATQVGRPCLLGYIGKCSAPCVGRITPEDHRGLVQDFCSFMSGQGESFIRDLDRQMREAAGDQRYEEAARLRDRAGALRRAMERNTVVFPDGTDADVIGIADDELEAAVQVFHVRQGRIRGERGFILEKAEALEPGEYVDRVLQGVYGQEPASGIPREVLVSAEPDSTSAWEDWLSLARGSRVSVRVPQRGDKRALMDTTIANAVRVLASHKLKRSSDLTTRSRALTELQHALGLAEAPLRIECIDISTLQGQDTVASLVVFEDALPSKRDYRSFIIRTPGADDTAAVAEVVKRRFAPRPDSAEVGAGPGLGEEAPKEPSADIMDEPTADGQAGPRRRPTFAYPPGLFVVDGGQPQVRAAQDALMDAGIADVPVVGLAKRLEEVWLPDDPEPIILPRSSEALYLLQRIRDEAHRTAIALHRKRRGKRQTSSALDGIRGLGAAKAASLVRHFGSMRSVRAADIAALQRAPGIGPVLAETIHAALHPAPSKGDLPHDDEQPHG